MIKMSVNCEIKNRLLKRNIQMKQVINYNVNYKYLVNHLIGSMANQLDYKQIAIEFSDLIKDKYNAQIEKVILFGSVVKGETNQDSDIDIFVICKGDRFEVRRALMVDVIKFLLKYGIYISIKTLSTKDFSNVNNSGFMRYITQEGVAIG
jgi:predicted nucleotidyltransferase